EELDAVVADPASDLETECPGVESDPSFQIVDIDAHAHAGHGRTFSTIGDRIFLEGEPPEEYRVGAMANLSIWSFPTRVVFGPGAARETGNEATRLGAAKALIVTDKGLVAPVEEALRKAGVDVTIFSDVDPNPVEKNVVDGVRAYRQSGAALIVAVGGGSPLDVGKIIRLKARPGVTDRH